MTNILRQATLKRIRDEDRRFLKAKGWKAVHAVKPNGSFKWVWIIAGRKKAYSRLEALRIAKRK